MIVIMLFDNDPIASLGFCLILQTSERIIKLSLSKETDIHDSYSWPAALKVLLLYFLGSPPWLPDPVSIIAHGSRRKSLFWNTSLACSARNLHGMEPDRRLLPPTSPPTVGQDALVFSLACLTGRTRRIGSPRQAHSRRSQGSWERLGRLLYVVCNLSPPLRPPPRRW